MGLFSSKTVVHTDSQAYNLAGDLADRPNLMRAAVLKHVLTGNEDTSFGRVILSSLSNGTAMGDVRFYRHGLGDYPYRMRPAQLAVNTAVTPAALYAQMRTILSLGPADRLSVIAAEVDGPDPFYFAEAWLHANNPALLDVDWTARFDNVLNQVIVTRPGQADLSFTASTDMIWAAAAPDRRLLYASYQIFRQDPTTLLHIYDTPQLFVYRMNSGNSALDALDGTALTMSEFFPVIPVMQNGKFLNEPGNEVEAAKVQKAYRKLTGGNLNKLYAKVDENVDAKSNVRSIYLVKGVSLNTLDNMGKRYILRFFRTLNAAAPTPPDALVNALTALRLNAQETWIQRSLIQNLPTSANFGVPRPDLSTFVTGSMSNSLTLEAVQPGTYKVSMSWASIKETQHVGNWRRQLEPTANAFAKVNDVGLSWKPITAESILLPVLLQGKANAGSTLSIYEQISEYRFKRLTIEGLIHTNTVYDKSSVNTTTQQALTEEDPDSSSLIIPLHYPTWKSFSLNERAQLSYSTSYLVFNSVLIQKIKWYQRGFFKFLLAIAGFALTLFTGGASLALGGGILGSNVAIGITLGASAAAAAIVGAVANYIAAMLLSQIIQMGATKLFGEKLGAILGSIIGFVAMQFAGQFGAAGNFDVDWGSLMRVENLMGLTNAVTGAYQSWLVADTASIYDEMGKYELEYKKETAEITAAAKEILGKTSGEIDPMMFTNATEYLMESRRSFLSRTLLTGSDISALSIAMIEDFVSTSLELPTAI